MPSLAGAAPELASFESFYHQSWSMSPWSWALAAVAAIVAAAAVLIFAPAAGPVVTGIGTWIGGMFGFSGIAATFTSDWHCSAADRLRQAVSASWVGPRC